MKWTREEEILAEKIWLAWISSGAGEDLQSFIDNKHDALRLKSGDVVDTVRALEMARAFIRAKQ